MAESEEQTTSWWMWMRRVKMLAWNSIFKKLRSWHPIPSLHGKQKGKNWKLWQGLFSWALKSLWMVTSHRIKRCLLLGRKAMTNLLAYSLQSCSTLHNPMDCSLPGSSVLWILQSRILDWVTMPSPLVLPDPGIEPLFPADSVLKIKDITFLTEVHIVKATVFPVVMYRY